MLNVELVKTIALKIIEFDRKIKFVTIIMSLMCYKKK